jgi:aminopeptidase YwaD
VIRRLVAVVCLTLLVASLAGAAPFVPPDAGELGARAAELAAPEMEGRGSATPGGERAAQHIVDALAAAGLHPRLQPFSVDRTPRVASTSALELVPRGDRLALGQSWQPHGGAASGEVVGEVVFVGYGLSMPERGRDDYVGVDVHGRIALVLDGAPAPLAEARPSRLDKLVAARRHGARAVLMVGDTLPSPATTAARVAIVSGALTRSAAESLLAATGRRLADLEEAARDRPASVATGVEVRLRVDVTEEDRRAANVVAVLPGTDPALAGEGVVLGAHYDHLGRVGGQVHPGADDNASGTAVVLGLARAFAAAGGTPRTLVFVLFSGEELGLLGSSQYVRAPAWPIARTVAMVNFDMVGRMRDGRLTVGGVASGAGLSALVREAARDVPLDLALRDSPFGPSDHARFYAAGTPVLFFHTGVHDDYHQPSDVASKLDASGMAKVAAVGARVVTALAGGPRPAFVRVSPPARPARTGAGAGQAFLGVTASPRGESDGLMLGGVVPDAAAARAGLHDGDVLVRVGDLAVNSFEDLRTVLRAHRPGDTLGIVYLRDGEDHVTSVTLDARP